MLTFKHEILNLKIFIKANKTNFKFNKLFNKFKMNLINT